MPELRKDPIVGRWVIISTDRSQRLGEMKRQTPPKEGGFCPFCAGNEEATPAEISAIRPKGGKANASDWSLRIVPNKFPALRVEGNLNKHGDGVYDMMNGIGAHEVIIETPNHKATLAQLSEGDFINVIKSFSDRTNDLMKDARFKYVLVFKNNGIAAGATLEHPHTQLIALPIVPKTVVEEIQGSEQYYKFKERCLYCDIISQEIEDQKRVIMENEHFISICPFAPRFPFETWVLPKGHLSNFNNMDEKLYPALMHVFQGTLKRIEKGLDNPPYNFMIHSGPLHMDKPDIYHWHIEITPRLTRVAGFERGSGFYINPTAPEVSAQFLRELEI